MTEKLAAEIKKIYSLYHAGNITPEEALGDLELAIAESDEE